MSSTVPKLFSLGTTVEMCKLLNGSPFSSVDVCSIVNMSNNQDVEQDSQFRAVPMGC